MTPDQMNEAAVVIVDIPAGPAYAISPNSRTHWGAKSRATNAAATAVRAGIEPGIGLDCPVKLHWTVYLGKGRKRLDNDNMLACLKPHTDALVRNAVIVNDSPEWIPDVPTVEQVLWSSHREQEHIVVRIEPAPMSAVAENGGRSG